MASRYSSIIYRPDMVMLTYDGQFIGGPFPLDENSHHRPVPCSRTKLIDALCDTAINLGINILFDKRVIEYAESVEESRAYVITDQGERYSGDVVIAADGIGTKVGSFLRSAEVNAISSGYSVYRVSYPTELLQEDEFLAQQYKFEPGQPDYCEVYIGPEGNMIVLVSPEDTTWLFTHVVSAQELAGAINSPPTG